MSYRQPAPEQPNPPQAGPEQHEHAQAPPDDRYDTLEVDDPAWPGDRDELPPRPRRRLLTPAPLILIAVLLIACGFIGGVLVEKGQTSAGGSASAAAGLASQFGALRGTGARRGAGSTTESSASSSAVGSRGGEPASTASGGAFGAAAASRAGATVGEVAFVSGRTLYVRTAEGNTVKVRTSPASSVSKTVKSSVRAIHPGETVLVSGSSAANGTVEAESIRVGSIGGLGGLFGRAGGDGGGGSGGARGGGTGSAAGGEPALFGNGG